MVSLLKLDGLISAPSPSIKNVSPSQHLPSGKADHSWLGKSEESDGQDPRLADLAFRYPLRRYQNEILDLINSKLAKGERQFHVVAPPGAGKTIIGLQIISQFKCPSLVLSPNTTIQSQWGQKLDLFLPPDMESLIAPDILGNHEDKPLKPITLLTYQVLSTPGKEQEYLEKLAHQSWVKELTQARSSTIGDAELRILELMQNNKAAYQREISRHVTRLRRKLSEVMDLKEVLHANALSLMQALRRQNFGLVIFDECHHLTDYWAAIMVHLTKQLGDPVIIGLTGTPPEGKSVLQETRYLSLVGDIDYQVPTPALVREGGLSPFQDLVYFTEPTECELKYLESLHEEFHALLEELVAAEATSTGEEFLQLARKDSRIAAQENPAQMHEQLVAQPINPAPLQQYPQSIAEGQNAVLQSKQRQTNQLTQWVLNRIDEIAASDRSRHPQAAWQAFLSTNEELACAFSRYLWKMKIPFPFRLQQPEIFQHDPLLQDWMQILEDFALRKLKLSANKKDHLLYERIKAVTRKLGYALTEQGLRRQASPADRVLAFSKSKPQAVSQILDLEYRSMEDRLRAVVVTDFEQMSATSIKPLNGVLDQESGGAIAVLKELLAHPVAENINPCLVTGSLLYVDKRITERFLPALEDCLKQAGVNIKLNVKEDEAALFSAISSNSSQWESRLYVGIVTQIFERGLTKCLIGTRGIFGEGWDSQALNTMIDLTTTTSPVSIKQLRGRSIRIQTNDPLAARKVANNWDVVCIAPQLEKGLNDYERFARKHAGYFGICEDGHIECGVGHVHASFTELSAIEVFASSAELNQEMMNRALVRDKIYDLWKVGQPYNNRLIGCVELRHPRKMALTPPHLKRNIKYKDHAKQLRAALNSIWIEYAIVGSIVSFGTLMLAASSAFFLASLAPAPLIAALALAKWKHWQLFQRLQRDVCKPNTQESALIGFGSAVLTAMQAAKLLPQSIDTASIKTSRRSDGGYRVFLEGAEAKHSKIFANGLTETLAPVSNQPYLVPKFEYFVAGDDDISDKQEKKFFRQYLRGRAEPRVVSYHAIPSLLARSEKGRLLFEQAWNKFVSPGLVVATETKPELLNRYFGLGPSLAQRLLWE